MVVDVPGDSGDDVMTATSADTFFTSSPVAPPPLDLTFFSFHGAVIYNCCRNCSTVRIHDTVQGIIPNNIHWTIEIVHDQRILTNDTRVCVTVKLFLLISVICQDCINSHGLDGGGNRSFTKNCMPCQCRVLTIG